MHLNISIKRKLDLPMPDKVNNTHTLYRYFSKVKQYAKSEYKKYR